MAKRNSRPQPLPAPRLKVTRQGFDASGTIAIVGIVLLIFALALLGVIARG